MDKKTEERKASLPTHCGYVDEELPLFQDDPRKLNIYRLKGVLAKEKDIKTGFLDPYFSSKPANNKLPSNKLLSKNNFIMERRSINIENDCWASHEEKKFGICFFFDKKVEASNCEAKPKL